MSNWAIDPLDSDGTPLVLCEPHALTEVNAMASLVGLRPYDSMEVACLILTTLVAAAGFDLGLNPTDVPCDECGPTYKESA